MDKDTLLEQKRIVDWKLAKKKAQLTEARADAKLNKRYMKPAHYAQLELDVATLAQRSQSIQMQLSALKKGVVHLNDCFRDVAAKVLSEKQYSIILEMAYDMKKARDIAA